MKRLRLLFDSTQWSFVLAIVHFLTRPCLAQTTKMALGSPDVEISSARLKEQTGVLSGTTVNLPVRIQNLTDHEVTLREPPVYHGIFLYGVGDDGSRISLYPFDPARPLAESHVEFTPIEPHESVLFKLAIPTKLLNVNMKAFQLSVVEIVWDDRVTRKRHPVTIYSTPFALPFVYK